MYRILYVDDEPALLEIAKVFLEQGRQFSVDIITSAPAALALLDSKDYDAIIADYQMPEMDGIELLKAVRTSGNAIPFILFTGRGREEVVIQALNEGADFYLQKGGDPRAQFAELSNKIRYAVKRRSAEEALMRDEEELRKKNQELNASFEQITAVEEELRSNVEDLTWQAKALRESEERYRNVVEDQTEFISRFLPDGTHVFVNESYCRYFGLNRDEVIGHRFRPKIPVEDQERMKRFFASLTPGHPVDTIEHRIILPDGSIRWQQWTDRALFDKDGHIREYQSVGRDISDKKKADDDLRVAYEQIAASEEELRHHFDELKKSEDALRESERKFQGIVQGSPIPQFVIDKDHRIVSWNRALEEYSGVNAKEVLGTTHAWKAFYEKERPVLSDLLVDNKPEKIQELYAGKYSKSKYVDGAYEVTDFFHRMGGHGTWLYFTATALRDSHGNIVGAVETLEDITDRKNAEVEVRASYEQIAASEEELRHQFDELKRSEDALRESEEKYRSILENIQDVYYRSDPAGNLVLVSPSAIQLLGYDSVSELIGKNIAQTIYYHPEERSKLLAELTSRGSISDYEVTLKKRDGTPVQVSTSSHGYFDPSGKFLGVEGIFRDITERKRTEDALRKNQFLLEDAMDQGHMAYWEFDVPTKMFTFNDRFYALFGTTAEREGGYLMPAEVYAREFVHPDDSGVVASEIDKCMKTSDPGYFSEIEHRIVRRDREVRDIVVRLRITKDGNGTTIKTNGVNQDITGRRQVEEALRESEEKYRTVFETTGAATVLIENDATISLANSEFERLSGYSKSEIENKKKWTEFVVKEDLDRMLAQHRLRRTDRNNALIHYEFRFISQSGEIHDIYLTNGIIPGTSRSVSSLLDITGRKTVEDRLVAANVEYTNLLNQIQDVYYRCDTEGNLIVASRSWATLLGYDDISECLGKSIADDFYLNPPDRKKFQDEIHRAGKVTDYVVTLRKKDGSPVVVATSSHLCYDSAGKILGIEGTFRDITESKRQDERLMEVNRAFLAFSPDPVGNINILTGVAGRILKGTCALYNRFESGMLCSLGMWNTPQDYAPYDTAEGHVCNDLIIEGGSSPTIITNLLKSSYADTDPNVKRYQLQTYIGIPVKIGKKSLGSLCVVYQDIVTPSSQELAILAFLAQAIAIEDERRVAMQALQESEEKFRGIFAAESDGIAVVDRETGIIIGCNDAFPLMHGYRKDELIGQPITATSAESDATRAAIKESTGYIQNRYHRRKDGSTFPVEITVNETSLQGRNVLIGAIRNITEKKLTEEALHQANKKLNLLSSITRHDINNQLLALKTFLELSKKSHGDAAAMSEYIARVERAANAIEHQIAFTKEYQDLGIKAPDWQSVEANVRKAQSVLPMRDIPITLADNDIEVYADPLFETVFYNLIDNALKYGGQKMTMIRISYKETEKGLVISVEDDGIGIPVEDKKHLFSRGFGHHTGLGLFLSREILSITGITITETGEPGFEARFEITVPKGAYRFTSSD